VVSEPIAPSDSQAENTGQPNQDSGNQIPLPDDSLSFGTTRGSSVSEGRTNRDTTLEEPDLPSIEETSSNPEDMEVDSRSTAGTTANSQANQGLSDSQSVRSRRSDVTMRTVRSRDSDVTMRTVRTRDGEARVDEAEQGSDQEEDEAMDVNWSERCNLRTYLSEFE
jgi:hypothetical protein